jgi:large subunit ribosomal protein L4
MAAPKAPYIGKKGTVTLDAAIFGEPFHEHLVHEAVRAELNARRQGSASTLRRGEVAMTGAKAFRQKGTGRARAGALSSPQRTGGGVAFGPKPRHFTVKVNRKARRRALRAVLSLHADRGSLGVVDPGDFSEPSTKTAADALAGFGEGGRVLVVLSSEGEETCVKSFRNIAGVTVVPVERAGVADIVGAARLVVSPAALERFAELAAAERIRPPDQEAAA